MHKNEQLAIYSDFEPSCIRCLSKFKKWPYANDDEVKKYNVGMNMIDETDHFRVNSELKKKLRKEFCGDESDKMKAEDEKVLKLDRNLL